MLKPPKQSPRIRGFFIFLVCLLVLGTSKIHALPIDNGSFTSSGGLDWLDLTESRGMSYNKILAATQDTTSNFYGWRYASGNEFDALMLDFGFSSNNVCSNGFVFCDTYNEGLNGLNTAIAMLGDTYVDYLLDNNIATTITSGYGYSWGLLADEYSSGYHNSAMLADSLNGQEHPDSIRTHWGHINPDYINHANSGSYLVRKSIVSEVPEPASLSLLCLGLVSLVLTRRRKS